MGENSITGGVKKWKKSVLQKWNNVNFSCQHNDRKLHQEHFHSDQRLRQVFEFLKIISICVQAFNSDNYWDLCDMKQFWEDLKKQSSLCRLSTWTPPSSWRRRGLRRPSCSATLARSSRSATGLLRFGLVDILFEFGIGVFWCCWGHWWDTLRQVPRDWDWFTS